jgi:hypothetical protein
MKKTITKIYNYKKQTGEYLSQSVATNNPLGKGVLIPALATKTKPPAAQDGFARCFINHQWVQKIDNRHQIKYLNEHQVVFNLGDEITTKMTNEPAPLISTLIERKKQAIRHHFNQSELLPVEVDGVRYHGGYLSSLKLDAAKRLSELAKLDTVTFFDTANQPHELSIIKATKVILALGQAYQTKFSKKQVLINTVEALGDDATQDDIDRIDSLVLFTILD